MALPVLPRHPSSPSRHPCQSHLGLRVTRDDRHSRPRTLMVEPPRIDHQGPVHECRPPPGYPVMPREDLKKTNLGWQVSSLCFLRHGPGRPQEVEALHHEDPEAKIPR